MFIWIILFLIILAASLILAWRSMTDYYEQSANFSTPYSLYLVGNHQAVNEELLNKLHQESLSRKFVISWERLFKGLKRALVVFGPAVVLKPWEKQLQLVELEDYSQKVKGQLKTWEIGLKRKAGAPLIDNLISSVPQLAEDEEFWWQLVLQPHDLNNNKELCQFEGNLRAVLITNDSSRKKELQNNLLKIGVEVGLARLPQEYQPKDLLNLYQKRTLSKKSVLYLVSKEILSLLGV